MLIDNILELIHITESYPSMMKVQAKQGTLAQVKSFARVPVSGKTYGMGVLKDAGQALADTTTGGLSRIADAKTVYDAGKEIHGLATANNAAAQKTSLMKSALSKVPLIGNTLADSAGEKIANHRNFYDVEKGIGMLKHFTGKEAKDINTTSIKPGSIVDGLHKTLKTNCQANPQLCRNVPTHLWKT
jgi:hypothetical protein